MIDTMTMVTHTIGNQADNKKPNFHAIFVLVYSLNPTNMIDFKHSP